MYLGLIVDAAWPALAEIVIERSPGRESEARMIMHIERVTECRLAVTDEVWPFAVARRGEIEAHWVEAIAANPTLFDGEVFVMPEWGVADGILTGRLLPTPFSAYHYWRETGFAGWVCTELDAWDDPEDGARLSRAYLKETAGV